MNLVGNFDEFAEETPNFSPYFSHALDSSPTISPSPFLYGVLRIQQSVCSLAKGSIAINSLIISATRSRFSGVFSYILRYCYLFCNQIAAEITCSKSQTVHFWIHTHEIASCRHEVIDHWYASGRVIFLPCLSYKPCLHEFVDGACKQQEDLLRPPSTSQVL